MKIEELNINLCYNEDSTIYNQEEIQEHKQRIQEGEICYCENCFYGRTELAQEILRLNNILKEWKMTKYINRKDNNGTLETVDDFPYNTEQEIKYAKEMLLEYQTSDRSAEHYLSLIACKDYNN